MKKIVGFSVLGALALFLLVVASHINNVPVLQESVKSKWGQVENVYQRRADLIPNLVEVVKGYASHERETLTNVIEARAKATQTVLPKDIATNPAAAAAFMQNQDALSSALSRLMVSVERYPDLKANANFLQLQSQIEGTENRIAVERRKYVQAIEAYNLEVRTFPGVIVARALYGAMPMEQFAAAPGAASVPKVSFK